MKNGDNGKINGCDRGNFSSSLHVGHRARLKSAFLAHGLEGMPDHKALELLLFYAIPRKDTNLIAHRLIDRFGSLQGALDADVRELTAVEGVGENAAAFLKLIPAVCARYSMNKLKKRARFSSIEKAGEFFVNYYRAKSEEEASALFLDSANRLISFEHLQYGSLTATPINVRRVVELAMNRKAASIILAHNHPSGDAIPSPEDLSVTRHLMDAFLPIDLKLKAHLVVSGGSFCDILPTLYERERFQVKYLALSVNKPDDPASPGPDAEKRNLPKEKTEE